MGLKLELDHAFCTRSYPGSPLGGDTCLIVPNDDGALIAVVDATGHGLGAYAIAQKARGVVQKHADRQPDALLLLLDEALKGTDGAAAMVLRIHGQSITYSGIGNVSGQIGGQVLHYKQGILGWRMRRPELTTAPFAVGSWLLLHTDGVSRPEAIPAGHAQTIVQSLINTHGSSSDDASVLAARWQEKL